MTTRQQTRRSISVRGTTYDRLQKHCMGSGDSISGFVEKAIAEKLDALGVSPHMEVAVSEAPRVEIPVAGRDIEVVAVKPQVPEPARPQTPQPSTPSGPLGDFKGSNFTF